MLRTEEYYKILHFLKVESVDRIYPVEEYFFNENGQPVVFDGDSFLFKTNRQEFIGLDYVEILLESTVECDAEDLVLNISEYEQGYDPRIVLNGEKKTISPDTPTQVIFKIKKSQTMSETSRNLTNIKSIELITENNSNFKIHEICFRDNNAPFTLEQLDAFYENGKYYILSRLHMDDVPSELADHVYTATAGYAWMSVWEYEARVMNDDTKNAMSYGKWLFATVDQAIESYKVANGIADDEELFVMDELVTFKPLRW